MSQPSISSLSIGADDPTNTAAGTPRFSSADWYRGLTLEERIATLKTTSASATASAAAPVFSDARAQGRIKCWREEPQFAKGPLFAERLASSGTNETELTQILGESEESLAARCAKRPSWLADLTEAFEVPAEVAAASLPESWRNCDMADLQVAFAPLIARGRKQLRDGVLALCRTWTEPPFDPATVEEMLLSNLPFDLQRIIGRTMVLELNVARLLGLLEGETPEERYRSFARRLQNRDVMLALLQEYPVMARELTNCVDHSIRFSLEFLGHLCADWKAIRATFSPDIEPGPLVALDGNRGDTHRGGRAVMVAEFASGLHVVYKPKSLAVDAHFQELLTWINGQNVLPPFRTFSMVDCETHGWVEFVPAGGCQTPEEIDRFYRRQGGYLAILYALDATDFHSENLIASGEHPILLDLEALFHPRSANDDSSLADVAALNSIHRSVLHIGLLPERVWSASGLDGVDISGLSSPAGQMTPFGVATWDSVGTDEMRLVRERMEMLADPNRPALNGEDVRVTDYTEQIVDGFTRVYRMFAERRDALIGPSGVLSRFADDEIRFIARATKTYGVLLDESYHPDVFRDALDRDRLYDRLWIGADYDPSYKRLIPHELDELWRGDIPMFTTRPGSRDLWSGNGKRIADFFKESGMELVVRRVRQMGDADLAQQVWIIRASLATLEVGGDRAKLPSYRMLEATDRADRTRLLSAARAIGDRLEVRAIHGFNDASWIGLALNRRNQWSLVPLGSDLYDGLPGIAFFLAYLGRATGEDRYTELARAALATVRQQIREPDPTRTIGGFDGWGGLIYVMSHAAAMWNEPAMLADAEKFAAAIVPQIEKDDNLDIISGAAGCIGGLLSLYRVSPKKETLDVAIRCGDHLLARAKPMERGIAWTSHMPARGPLTGFSHGAAGMAWALLELAAASGETRFRTAAEQAIAYERSLFMPENGNWPDLRLPDIPDPAAEAEPVGCFMSWCHGAPGIGLARLRGLKQLDDAAIRQEIDTALATTLGCGFGANHTLCHGDLGNLEPLIEAARILDDPQWAAHVSRIAAMILDSIDRDGWLCAIPLAVETPGLMTGLAGIGFGLLRLADPVAIPSVLMLDAPRSVS